MPTDHHLQQAVLEEFKRQANVDAAHIGVVVREDVVTLTGHVASLGDKEAAVSAAGAVSGVNAVINEIAIEFPGKSQTPGELLAEQAYAGLADNPVIPIERIQLDIESGTVTLRGDVDTKEQRDDVEAGLRNAGAAADIHNKIVVAFPVDLAEVRAKVREALSRISNLDTDAIAITTKAGRVTLSGRVNSWHEQGIVESTVRSIAGVTDVVNALTVP